MSLLPNSQGIPRFDMRPQGHQEVVHRPEQAIVLFVSCGSDRYAYTWTRDGWDVQLVCFVHGTCSAPYPESDRVFCRRCSFCEWERWLTSAECERSLERFRDITAVTGAPIGLGSQGHGH